MVWDRLNKTLELFNNFYLICIFFLNFSHHNISAPKWMRLGECRKRRLSRGKGKQEKSLDEGDVHGHNAPWMLWDITDVGGLLQNTLLGTMGVLHPLKTWWFVERGQRQGALLHLAAYSWWMNGRRGDAEEKHCHTERIGTRLPPGTSYWNRKRW